MPIRGIVGPRGSEERQRRSLLFIRIDGGEGNARMMVIIHLTSEECSLLVTNSLSVLGQMDNNLMKPHS